MELHSDIAQAIILDSGARVPQLLYGTYIIALESTADCDYNTSVVHAHQRTAGLSPVERLKAELAEDEAPALVVRTIENAPALEHDAMMLARFGHAVDAEGILERRIVWNLCKHMYAAGFAIFGVHDGEERTQLDDAKGAMELIFNLDDATLIFRKGGTGKVHGVFLVLGNGCDIISDWNYSDGDADGFNAAMEAFDTEQYV